MSKNPLMKLGLLCLATILASCGQTNPTSSAASSSKTEASSAQTASTSKVVSSSSEAQKSSSSEPASSTQASSSSEKASSSSSSVSSTSQAPVAHNVTKALDLATMLTSYTASAANCTDGFFTLIGGKAEATSISTQGGSDPTQSTDSKKHYISFTTLGAGSIAIHCKTGSDGSARDLFVAQVNEDGATYKVIGRVYNAPSKSTYQDLAVNLTAKGTYWILTSDNVAITTMSVIYDENNLTTVEATPLVVAPADPAILAPMDFYPMALTANMTIGDWAYEGTASAFTIQSSRTIAGAKNYSMRLDLMVGDKLKLTAAAAGSVSIFAESSDAATGSTITYGKVGETGVAATTLTNVKSAKTLTAVTFSVEAATYEITASMETSIFLAQYNAL